MCAMPRPLQPIIPTTTFSLGPLAAARNDLALPRAVTPAARTEVRLKKSRRVTMLFIALNAQVRKRRADGVDDLDQARMRFFESLHRRAERSEERRVGTEGR